MTYRFLALSTEAVHALETCDLELVSIIDEPIGALVKERRLEERRREVNDLDFSKVTEVIPF